MSLFGPNIEKMKEKGDVGGLINELKNKDLTVKIEVTEALMDIGDRRVMELLSQVLLAPLRFENDEDKVETITLIQGRAPTTMFLTVVLDSQERIKTLEKVRFRKKLDLDLVRLPLFEAATDQRNKLHVGWYALTALAELGDRSAEVAQLLINTAEAIMTWSKEQGIGRSGIGGAMLEMGIQEETMRALSYFTGNNEVKDLCMLSVPSVIPLLVNT